MSIFDNMDPGQIAEAIDRQFGAGSAQNVMGANQAPVMPEPPSMGGGQSDMSGFAGAGLTPPPLTQMPGVLDMSQPAALPVSDPMKQIAGIMAMSGTLNKRQRPEQQQGGLMAYLQSLGV